MASKITVTPEELRRSAGKFKNGASTTEQLVKSLTNEVNNLKSQWEGAAHSTFTEKFTQLSGPSGPLKDFINVLNGLNSQLTEVAKAMEEVDRQIAAKLK